MCILFKIATSLTVLILKDFMIENCKLINLKNSIGQL